LTGFQGGQIRLDMPVRLMNTYPKAVSPCSLSQAKIQEESERQKSW